MVKFLIGGSPCTHWSIAQSKNRETEAEGIGWELFKNYLIAKEKFKPDFFLYENNKSAAQAIKDSISEELQTPLQYINSALVSAQNRQRFYVHNMGDVPQPQDRGILLRDIIESGDPWLEKSYALTTRCSGAIPEDTLKRHRHTMIAERILLNTTVDGKAQCVRATCYKDGVRNLVGNNVDKRTCVAERVDMDAFAGRIVGRRINADGHRDDYNTDIERVQRFEVNTDPQKTNTISTVEKDNMIAEPLQFTEANYEIIDGAKIYIADGKIRQGDENGTKQGKYIYAGSLKTNTLSAGQAHNEKILMKVNDVERWETVYEVRGGLITIKGLTYQIKLPDGYYIIRKLTVTECCRLQTLPDDYCRAVSASQAYKGLGNGWTAEVIMHILRHANVPLDEEIVVLSMYDGIGTGRYCFDKLGYKNVKYHAYEIDKYAMQVAMSNYPDIIQCGDAFQVREAGWRVDR